MHRVTIHWALALATILVVGGNPATSVAEETAPDTELISSDLEDEDIEEAASRIAAAEIFDAIPAPIEKATLPDVAPDPATLPSAGAVGGVTSEPLPEPNLAVPAEPVPPPPPSEPKVVVAPHSPVATALLSSLRPTVVPKRKIVKPTPEATLKQQLWRFYSERGGEPVWLKNGQFSDAALSVVAEIARAKDWGLDPAAFDVPVSVPASAPEKELVDVEMKFTRAVMDYATQARTGRVDPVKISDLIDRMSVAPNAYDVLMAVSTGDAGNQLLTFHPKHPQFDKLRKAYVALRDGQEGPLLVTVPDGPKLKPGASHPHVALVRQRLKVPAPVAAGDAEGNPAELYDPALADAVKAFQKERGLKADGLIARPLRNALNGDKLEPREKRLERMLANLERWRWTPNDWGTTHVHNNIPDFMTRMYVNGEVTFTERIVVGKPNTPTSIFSDRFEYVEFNPNWNVPGSIKVNELWPAIQRGGGGALARQGLKVNWGGKIRDGSEIDWGSVDIRQVHIFQPPGASNALGRVKFMFPNKHDIYMHDTPSKALFNESTRAFSHGCMRVRNPDQFAQALMGVANDASQHDVQMEFANDENHQVPLKKKIPIHVTYFTTWIEEDGTMRVRNDIYGHDRRTTLALAGKFAAIERQTGPKAEFTPGEVSALGNGDRRRETVASQQGGAGSVFTIFDLFAPDPQPQVKSPPSRRPSSRLRKSPRPSQPSGESTVW